MKNIQTIKNLNFTSLKIDYHTRYPEIFVKNYFIDNGYDVIKITRKHSEWEVGIPDLLCIKDKKKTYVEVKYNGDGIRRTQLKWIINNPTKEVLILFLNEKE